MGVKGYDFAGWATKFDVRCSDGRTIRKDAFKGCDGKRVPLVWQHNHSDIDNVLGHALLEARDEGMWAYAFCNNSEKGQLAKDLVKHQDIDKFSIYANKLVQRAGDVMHGEIKEVSLVLAGANPEATIEFPYLEHYDYDEDEATEAIIKHADGGFEIYHADPDDEEDDEDFEEEDEMHVEHAEDEGKTIGEILETLNDEQREAVNVLVGLALEEEGDTEDDADSNSDEAAHFDEGGNQVMKRNVFDNSIGSQVENTNVLSHSELNKFAKEVFSDIKRYGSFKESCIAHADTYGIKKNQDGEGIELLFPDWKELNTPPQFIQRNMEWVGKVLSSVHRTPFSRIKTTYADITEDEARARGYMKGKLKKEEVFTLLKRTTDPQTIYKKQKMDRDDLLDITSFDFVAWLRKEMRMMLEEEIARAVLIGDGRNPSSDDKIREAHVHSIYNDEELYSIRVTVEKDASDADKTAKAIIRGIIKNRKQYKGSGSPTLYINEDYLTDMLLMEDGIGHSLYPTVDTLSTKLRVKEIVPVEPMTGLTREGTGEELVGILVNLIDYNIGADKGGEIHSFEDFDIDYNQEKYLIETRISGALIKPYSAMVIETKASGGSVTPTP